ncbi:MAG: tRNA (N(6)-L-threonylcarbamoyladenosine(37)-C(2))-methylthiotransferase MtaB [Ruminococcaceae bacterium]|nr:tRNA (N(6)-L-threonylcarbamoyladenosine(37)-C(2))-methylthiotransferase MtaB [Oscillospiraceae bacterium]
MKASIFTLGCRVNQYESDAVAEMLAGVGFEIVPFGEECDITVINTCTVTAESDRKSRQHIRRAKSFSPEGAVIVTGCYAQIAAEGALSAGAAAVVGNGEKSKIADIALSLVNGERDIKCVGDILTAPYDRVSVSKPTRARAYIKIEDGCENRCAYCIIPKARGGVRSRPVDDVISEISAIAKKGYSEVILTGIETASYGRDLSGIGLSELLLEVGRIDGIERITMGSLEPTVMNEAFVENLARVRGLLPHFHLSIQSGCTRTLNRMRRKYTAEKALSAIERVRRYIPEATFSADVIVGFPGETEEDFLETVEFCRRARFLHLHIFPYSIREGTEAATMPDQVPEPIKKQRAATLAAVGEEIQNEILEKYILEHGESSPAYVLCETYKNGISNGHTEHFIECDFETDESRIGEIVPVAIVGRLGSVLLGKALVK